MPETLGSLCDKLTILKLKQFHCDDDERLASLAWQEKRLTEEIDTFVGDAVSGRIPEDALVFAANKVYKKDGNPVREITGSMGAVFAELAAVNCSLWHEQEKVYEFERVLPEDKDAVVKRLAILNLERNKCIDAIDAGFAKIVRTL